MWLQRTTAADRSLRNLGTVIRRTLPTRRRAGVSNNWWLAQPTTEWQIDLADVCLRLGDQPAAFGHAQAVLSAADADQVPARRLLHRRHMASAGVQEIAGRAAEALQSYEQARQAILPLTNGKSPAAADLAALCSTHLAVGNLQRRQQDLAAAIVATRAALETAKRARTLEPQTARYGELVALSERRAARLLRQRAVRRGRGLLRPCN